jgi:hypothetical protein
MKPKVLKKKTILRCESYLLCAGMVALQQVAVRENIAMIELQLATKYLALAASNALLKYIEFSQSSDFIGQCLQVSFSCGEGTMLVDAGLLQFCFSWKIILMFIYRDDQEFGVDFEHTYWSI